MFDILSLSRFPFTFPKRMEQLKSYTANNKYYISTNDTPDNGLETMVFKVDSDGKVSDWTELDCMHYDTIEEAVEGHQFIVNRWNTVS